VDFTQAMKLYDKKLIEWARKYRLETQGDMCALSPPDIDALDRERWDIAKAHVVRLQVALGESAFKKIEQHVHDVWTPKPPLSEREKNGQKSAARK
jgi:hypothetical protein